MIFFYLFVSLDFLLLHQTNMLRAAIISLYGYKLNTSR